MKRTIIEEDKLSGYKILKYNLFIFIYDLLHFISFDFILLFSYIFYNLNFNYLLNFDEIILINNCGIL